MNLIHASALSGLAMTAGTWIMPAHVSACDEEAQVVVMQSVGTFDDDDDKTTSIAIRIVNGKVEVEVDGEAVDGDNVRQEMGRIVITDEDGNVVREMKLGLGGFDFDDMGFDVKFDNDFEFDRDMARFGPPGDDHPPVMLGIQMHGGSPALEKLGLSEGEATVIAGVIEGLPAAAAGLKRGDVIVAIDGKRPAGPEAIKKALSKHEPGDHVVVRIVRGDDEKDVKIKLKGFSGTALGFQFVPREMNELKFGDIDDMPETRGGKIFVGPDAEIFEFRGGDGREWTLDPRIAGDLEKRVRIFVKEALKDIENEALRKQIEEAMKGVDHDQMRSRVSEAWEGVDHEALRKQIDAAMKSMNREDVRIHVQEALADVDTEALQKRIEEALSRVDREDVQHRIEEAMSRFGDEHIQVTVREALAGVDHEQIRKSIEKAMKSFEFHVDAGERGGDEPEFRVWMDADSMRGDVHDDDEDDDEDEDEDEDDEAEELRDRIDHLQKRIAQLERLIEKLRDRMDD